jgi:hypothetical protein
MDFMSPFEIIMLVCFGVAWPFSIWKSYVSRSNFGKSFMFLFTAWIGYLAGIIHKIFYNPDMVVYLYILNGILITVDLALYFRNAKIDRAKDNLAL